MSGLCGWFAPEGTGPADPQVVAAMATALTRFDSSALRTATGGFGSVAAAGGDVDVHQGAEELVAVWGRATFLDPELNGIARQLGIARALADGYRRKRDAVFEVMSGSFALAILNGRDGEAILAIDRMGIRTLTYAVEGACLIFGSVADCINRHPAVNSEMDPQAIYNYVHFHMVPGPGTIYRKQARLLPGHRLRFAAGKAQAAPYWQMRFTENARRPFEELKQEFLDGLRTAVRNAAGTAEVGSFLSGGTDSSTIAGMLGEVSGEPARTYSIGFEAEGYDEMEYARIAARHFGTRHHEYYVTPDDVVKAIPAIAAVYDQPFGNASAVPTYYCAKLAKEDGIDTLLGGDGGDELFGGNARYAKQRLYSLYSDLPALLRQSVIEPIAFSLPEGIDIIGRAQRYVRNATQPMPARYDNYNLLERLGPATVFTPEFLDSVEQGQPLAHMAQDYHAAHAHTLINRMLAFDLKYTLADSDLPKVTRSCELAGVEVRYPMLDDAVVSFSASLAPDLKLKGTRLRYFFKEALRDFLPREILVKKKHGFGLPFGPWLRAHEPLRELVAADLHSLRQRGIVRPEFVASLLNDLLHSHAGYYGTMAWILMMLEQWFRQHSRPG